MPKFRLKPLSPTEHQVQSACLEYLAVCPAVAWAERINTGAVKIPAANGRDRFIRFGFPGCSDIIGMLKDGRFLAVEVKSPVGRATEAQEAFLSQVATHGGVAGVVRSVDALKDLLERP
jgi:hypothetical protein